MKYLFALILTIFLIFPLSYRIGKRALWDPDEGRNSRVIQLSNASGEWLIPHLDKKPRLEKPPLFYWAGSLITQLFGMKEATLRLTSLLSALAIIFVTFLLASEMWGENAAFYSSLILATFILFLIYSRIVIFDMLLTLFTAVAFYTYWMFKEHRKNIWIFIFYVCLSLAVLTKGPIGLFPAVIILPFHFLRAEKANLSSSFSWGIPLFLLLTLPWFIYIGAKIPKALEGFFIHENIIRFAKGVGHKEPMYFYIFLITAGTFPWWISFPRIFMIKWDKKGGISLCAFWFFFIFIFFSLSASKAPQYILPAMPAFALLMGKIWDEKSPHEAALLVGLASVFLPVGLYTLPMLPSPVFKTLLAGVFLFGIILVILWNILPKEGIFIMIVVFLLSLWGAGNLWIENLDPLHSTKEIVSLSSKEHYWKNKVVFYKSLMPSALFYLNKEGEKIKKDDLIIKALEEKKTVVSTLNRFWKKKDEWKPKRYLIWGKFVIMEGISENQFGDTGI